RFLDADTEAAPRQFIGAKEHCEVGTRAALSGAVYRIKFAAFHQPRLARKRQPLFARVAGHRQALSAKRGGADDVPSCGALPAPCGRLLFSCVRGTRESWRGGAGAVDTYALAKQSPFVLRNRALVRFTRDANSLTSRFCG